jgi:hypothetical protein
LPIVDKRYRCPDEHIGAVMKFILLTLVLTAVMFLLGTFGLLGFWYTSVPLAIVVYGIIAAITSSLIAW